MPPEGFEAEVLANEQPHTHTLDNAAIGDGIKHPHVIKMERTDPGCGFAVLCPERFLYGLQLANMFDSGLFRRTAFTKI